MRKIIYYQCINFKFFFTHEVSTSTIITNINLYLRIPFCFIFQLSKHSKLLLLVSLRVTTLKTDSALTRTKYSCSHSPNSKPKPSPSPSCSPTLRPSRSRRHGILQIYFSKVLSRHRTTVRGTGRGSAIITQHRATK